MIRRKEVPGLIAVVPVEIEYGITEPFQLILVMQLADSHFFSPEGSQPSGGVIDDNSNLTPSFDIGDLGFLPVLNRDKFKGFPAALQS